MKCYYDRHLPRDNYKIKYRNGCISVVNRGSILLNIEGKKLVQCCSSAFLVLKANGLYDLYLHVDHKPLTRVLEDITQYRMLNSYHVTILALKIKNAWTFLVPELFACAYAEFFDMYEVHHVNIC